MFEKHMLQPDQVKDYDYKEDIKFNLSISLEELEKLTKGNEILKDLLEEVLMNCLKYTESIFKMNKIIKTQDEAAFSEEIADASDKRKRVHDLTMESINILSRTMAKEGVDNSWIDKIGDSRAHYAKFAVSITMYRVAKYT